MSGATTHGPATKTTKEPKTTKPSPDEGAKKPNTVRFIATRPGHIVIVNPPYTEETAVGGKKITKNYNGDMVRFIDSFANVPAQHVEQLRSLPNYKVDYMEFDELQRMQESDDPDERNQAKGFLGGVDKHRGIMRLKPLTKTVLAV